MLDFNGFLDKVCVSKFDFYFLHCLFSISACFLCLECDNDFFLFSICTNDIFAPFILFYFLKPA